MSGAAPPTETISNKQNLSACCCVPFVTLFNRKKTVIKSTGATSAHAAHGYEDDADRRHAAIRADGGIVKVSEIEMHNFSVLCERYGADVIKMINEAKEDLNTISETIYDMVPSASDGSKEGIILLSGISDDIARLITFFQSVNSNLPEEDQKYLNTVITKLHALNSNLNSSIASLTVFINMTDDPSVVSASITRSETIVDINTIFKEIRAGLGAAQHAGFITGRFSAIMTRTLSGGLRFARDQVGTAEFPLPSLRVLVAPKPDLRSSPVLTLAIT